MSLTFADKILLNSGHKMPMFGLGTYMCRPANGGSAEKVVQSAAEIGYRLFDTAEYYENEAEVGRGIAKSQVPREEIFVVTKLWDQGYDVCKKAFEKSLAKLNTGYVDLYLIHSPLGGRVVDSYNAMIELQQKGLIRSIGVSNFGIHHLKALKEAGKPTPAVNQIELHPFCRQTALIEYCKQNGIVVMGYTPLAKGHCFNDSVLLDIADRHRKSPAQVMLRWSVQNGYVTIPKTEKIERLKPNADIFDFALSESDMKQLNSLPHKPMTWNPVDSPWTG